MISIANDIKCYQQNLKKLFDDNNNNLQNLNNTKMKYFLNINFLVYQYFRRDESYENKIKLCQKDTTYQIINDWKRMTIHDKLVYFRSKEKLLLSINSEIMKLILYGIRNDHMIQNGVVTSDDIENGCDDFYPSLLMSSIKKGSEMMDEGNCSGGDDIVFEGAMYKEGCQRSRPDGLYPEQWVRIRSNKSKYNGEVAQVRGYYRDGNNTTYVNVFIKDTKDRISVKPNEITTSNLIPLNQKEINEVLRWLGESSLIFSKENRKVSFDKYDSPLGYLIDPGNEDIEEMIDNTEEYSGLRGGALSSNVSTGLDSPRSEREETKCIKSIIIDEEEDEDCMNVLENSVIHETVSPTEIQLYDDGFCESDDDTFENRRYKKKSYQRNKPIMREKFRNNQLVMIESSVSKYDGCIARMASTHHRQGSLSIYPYIRNVDGTYTAKHTEINVSKLRSLTAEELVLAKSLLGDLFPTESEEEVYIEPFGGNVSDKYESGLRNDEDDLCVKNDSDIELSDGEDDNSVLSDNVSDDDEQEYSDTWVRICSSKSKYNGYYALARRVGEIYRRVVYVYIPRVDGGYAVKRTEIRSSKSLIVLSNDEILTVMRWLASSEFSSSLKVTDNNCAVKTRNSYYSIDDNSSDTEAMLSSQSRRSFINFNQWVKIESSTSKYNSLFGIAKGSSQKNCTSVQVYVDHGNDKFSVKTTTILTKALRPLKSNEIAAVKETLGSLFPTTSTKSAKNDVYIAAKAATPIIVNHVIGDEDEDDDVVSINDSDINGEMKESNGLVGAKTRWVRVLNPKSKFVGRIGQLKGYVDNSRCHVNIYTEDSNGQIVITKSTIGCKNAFEYLNDEEMALVKEWLGDIFTEESNESVDNTSKPVLGNINSFNSLLGKKNHGNTIQLQQWVRIHSSKSKYNGCFAVTDDHDNRFSDYYRVDAYVQQGNGKFIRGRTSVSSSLLVPLNDDEINHVRKLLGVSFPEGDKPGRGRKRKERNEYPIRSSVLDSNKSTIWNPRPQVTSSYPSGYFKTITTIDNDNHYDRDVVMKLKREDTFNSVTNISIDSNLDSSNRDDDECTSSTSSNYHSDMLESYPIKSNEHKECIENMRNPMMWHEEKNENIGNVSRYNENYCDDNIMAMD